MKKRVFVTRKIPMDGLRAIVQEFETLVWPSDVPPSEQEFIQNAKDCDGIVTMLSDPITANVLEYLPKLKVIAQYAVGYDNIDLRAATDRGIMVTNTPDVLTETTADLTWALILSTARRIVEADRYVRDGKWKVAWSPELLLGMDIYNATLGIVGMGRIGKAVARRAIGFGMKILYTSRSELDHDADQHINFHARRVELAELLRESDVISLHVPLTPQTKHLIGKEQLAMMKQDAILVNTSRGQVVDEHALFQALESGGLAAAGLDVYEKEPINADNLLLKLKNVVLVPHIGSASIQTRSTMAKMCAENLHAALNNERPPNIVNPEVI